MRIYVRAVPQASKNEVIKISDGEYKVRLTTPPIDGKANDMLLKILAEHFDVPKSSLQIVGGKSSRTKIVDVIGG